MTRTALGLALIAAIVAPTAQAASLSKSYSYFTIGGRTVEEIEDELSRRGPEVMSTGSRHPGATRMEFKSRLKYAERGGRCAVADARVSVEVKIILPRWSQRAKAEQEVRLIWNTLAEDIKRHEESHAVIAKNHAMELEAALEAIGPQRDCAAAATKAEAVTAAVLARHDAAQQRFDRIEGISFEKRLVRLLQYRLDRIESGRLRE